MTVLFAIDLKNLPNFFKLVRAAQKAPDELDINDYDQIVFKTIKDNLKLILGIIQKQPESKTLKATAKSIVYKTKIGLKVARGNNNEFFFRPVINSE